MIFKKFKFSSNLKLNNSLVMAPLALDFFNKKREGRMTVEEAKYIIEKGSQCGMIIIGAHGVTEKGIPYDCGWNIENGFSQEVLSELYNFRKRTGAKLIVQVYFTCDENEYIGMERNDKATRMVNDKSHNDIECIIDKFVDAAKILMDYNFDGIEIHGANSTLLQLFLSPFHNRRSDQWGGSVNNRCRIITDIIKKIDIMRKNSKNEQFIIGYRFTPEEISPGRTLDDSLEVIDKLNNLQFDYIHLSLRSWNQVTADDHRHVTKEIRKRLVNRVALITNGSIYSKEEVNCALNYSDLASAGYGIIMDTIFNNQKDQLPRELIELDNQIRESLIPNNNKLNIEYPVILGPFTPSSPSYDGSFSVLQQNYVLRHTHDIGMCIVEVALKHSLKSEYNTISSKKNIESYKFYNKQLKKRGIKSIIQLNDLGYIQSKELEDFIIISNFFDNLLEALKSSYIADFDGVELNLDQLSVLSRWLICDKYSQSAIKLIKLLLKKMKSVYNDNMLIGIRIENIHEYFLTEKKYLLQNLLMEISDYIDYIGIDLDSYYTLQVQISIDILKGLVNKPIIINSTLKDNFETEKLLNKGLYPTVTL